MEGEEKELGNHREEEGKVMKHTEEVSDKDRRMRRWINMGSRR